MANELTYQSIFQGEQIDARLTAVASLQEALAAVEQAITAKYTKPASGIPETDLDADVQSALAKARSAVQDLSNYYTKTEIDALLSAVNSQQYVDVTALPAASADTLGKIYLVGPDANNQYARYYTSYDGSAYSWVAAGTTEINLALYATKAELNQLSQEVDDVENELGSDPYKDSSINYNWTKGLLRTDGSTLASSGSTYRYSALIPVTPGGNIKIRVFSPNGSTVAYAFYAQDESVVDVSETGYTKGGTSVISVTAPNTAYYIRLQTNSPNLSEDLAGVYIEPFLPNRETVLKFSETSGSLNWNGKTFVTADDIEGDLKESDITIEVVSDNIADPSGIIDGKLVADGGAISNSASWSMYALPVSPGDVITFAGFHLGRNGYYAFYNGATLVSFGAYVDPNGVVSPYTVTVPSGANLLYFDIKSGNSPSNPYAFLQINEGNELLPYDVFRKAVTKILGEDLISSGSTGELSDIIADLPLSADGADIEIGYAYINSSTGAVIVKQ